MICIYARHAAGVNALLNTMKKLAGQVRVFFSDTPPLDGKCSRDRCQHVVLTAKDKVEVPYDVEPILNTRDLELAELFNEFVDGPDMHADAFW